MSCSMCPTMFDSIQNARQHYLEVHRLRNGYLRCCQIKMKSLTEVKEHIEWHSNPDLFRWFQTNASTLTFRLNSICLIRKKVRDLQRRISMSSCFEGPSNKSTWNEKVCVQRVWQGLYSKKFAGRSFENTRKTWTKFHLQHVQQGVSWDGFYGWNKKILKYFCCRFFNENYLKSHIERRHTTDQTHICEFCAKVRWKKTNFCRLENTLSICVYLNCRDSIRIYNYAHI